MLDPKTIGTWFGVLVAAGGVIAGSTKFLFWVFDEWQKRKKHEGFSAPTDTLRLASKPEGNCWWAMGKRGDEPTMQIVGSVFATNITTVPVRVPQVELRYGLCGRKRVSGMVMVARNAHENMYGMYDIPAGETRDASFDFWVYPPVAKPTDHFAAHSVTFIDQFGNRQVVKRVQFRSMAADHPPKPKEPEEFPYAIADAIEKEIVSVLKAELGRYEMCGRRVGGLGSVHIVYQGRAFTGAGGDSWTSDSPKNQLIVSDPGAAALKSDNLEPLVAFYKGLNTDDERPRFRKALLDRLDPKRGYLSISYFIVAVLWNVGSLAEALEKARRDLPTGESDVFGLRARNKITFPY
ncbi:MAG: hypothetical protein ABSG79_27345 [Bryobacteraceae bacterium]|jgi:hypothetical protein